MENQNLILQLYSRPQTIFTLGEISQLLPAVSYENLKSSLSYFAKEGKIRRLRPGIYAKKNYNPLELANKIYTPSYISLETVLKQEGIIFQVYETIFAVSYLSRKILVNNHPIFYRKIKDEVLLNSYGITEKDNYFIATPERAFLDTVMLCGDYHFDNLAPLNWAKVFKLQKIYNNKALEKRINKYYVEYTAS